MALVLDPEIVGFFTRLHHGLILLSHAHVHDILEEFVVYAIPHIDTNVLMSMLCVQVCTPNSIFVTDR